MSDSMTAAPSTGASGSNSLRVGVVGAGVMGRGIAEAVSTNGLPVVLVDLSERILQEAIGEISRSVKAQALMRGGRGPASAQILGRISLSTGLTPLAGCDVVIENIIETTGAKRDIYDQLGRILGASTVLAANTSTFPIGELAGYTRHPERVIGMHFMNPAQTKRFVEVIPGAQTSSRTVAGALDFLTAIGKTGILVRDAPGFVSNRVLMLTINEAIRTVEENTASAEDVDRVFMGCFGHPMGPLATADLIGLDTILLSLESLRTRLGDGKYEPAPLLRQLVDEHRLGRKTGHGFFSYGSNQ